MLAFAWPAARIAPRDLPVGIVGTGAASEQVLAGLDRSDPGGFDVRRYADQASARAAIQHRDIYGAFAVKPGGVTVLEASAASPSVAQLLSTVGQDWVRVGRWLTTWCPSRPVTRAGWCCRRPCCR